MTYFYIILYLKLKLRNANNSIAKSFDNKYNMNNYKMKNILKSLSSMILEINTYNNDFWLSLITISLNFLGFKRRVKVTNCRSVLYSDLKVRKNYGSHYQTSEVFSTFQISN
jgi:hypothetical protein